jgi:hypothetical protein
VKLDLLLGKDERTNGDDKSHPHADIRKIRQAVGVIERQTSLEPHKQWNPPGEKDEDGGAAPGP